MIHKLLNSLLARLMGAQFDVALQAATTEVTEPRSTFNAASSLVLLLLFIGMGTILMLNVANGANADYELPPRQTPVPGDQENPKTTQSLEAGMASAGSRVHLRVLFSNDWPWDLLHWQNDLWIVVQWHDHVDTWRDVSGWQGTLDTIYQEDGWVGVKELWISAEDLNSGPFRWLVYQGENGRLLATSDPFYLPAEPGALANVDMPLAP